MSAFKKPLGLCLLTTLAAITVPVTSATAQLTIVRVNGGGTAPSATGSGNLTTIFNAACDWWERTLITSPHTLTLTYRWGPQSGGTLAAHTLNAQGGTPNRETAGTIVFDNDGSSSWYLDPTPCDNSEWSTFTQNTSNYGAGVLIDEARWSGASGGASGNHDLFGVCLHEIGHALGLSSANTAYQAETGDNDIDVTSPRPSNGSTLAVNPGSAHLAISTALMWPSVSSGVRNIPSQVDLLANAQVSQMTGIAYRAACFEGCARYIPDSDATTGNANVIPFGTSLPSTLASTFVSDNGVPPVIYFDILPSTDIYLHGLDVNTTALVGEDLYCDIYTRSTTHVGNELSSAGWTARTAGIGVSAGVDNPSRIDFNAGLYMAQGSTVGVAVVARNFLHRYTNGNNTYSNADVTLNLGSATTAAFGGSLFTPRTGNISLRYQRDNATWHNQIYQTVLRASDLGPAGNISGLAFAPTVTGRHFNRFLTIKMAHKPANYTMSTTFATNISGGTTVLNEIDHVWHLVANTWNEIGLESPFAYNGVSDVVVEIFARGNHMSAGTSGGFRTGGEQRLYATGWPFAAQPATGTLGASSGVKIRAEFDCANSGYFGTSCGPAYSDSVGTPRTGTTYRVDIHDGVPSSGAFVLLGFTRTASSLTTLGFTNCIAWNDAVATVFKVTNTVGFAAHNVAIPNTPIFNGLMIYSYWANLDSTQPGGVTFTNGVRGVVGSENP